MALLDSIKDPNTGKIKTPILISLVGAGGLVLFLVMKGSGSSTTTSAGQSSPLTPDLTGLQAALQSLGQTGSGQGGGSGTTASVDPPPNPTFIPPAVTNTGGYTGDGGAITQAVGAVTTTPVANSQPTVPQAPGSSGSAGGGGGGTGQVIQPIAKAPTVYGGVTVAPAWGAGLVQAPSSTAGNGGLIVPIASGYGANTPAPATSTTGGLIVPNTPGYGANNPAPAAGSSGGGTWIAPGSTPGGLIVPIKPGYGANPGTNTPAAGSSGGGTWIAPKTPAPSNTKRTAV